MRTLFTIDEVPVGLVIRDRQNGGYTLYIDHDIPLARLEKINWAKPVIVMAEPVREGEVYLPAGYGFRLEELTYSSLPKQWQAKISVDAQYLGDVTGYQAQIDALNSQSAEQQSTITAQEQEIAGLQGQLAEADELAIALYEAQLSAEPEEVSAE